MGLFDWIGEAIGGAFHALAEFIGDAFKSVARAIVGEVVGSIEDAVPKMNAEVAVKSIDVNMFKTKEFQELVTELKKRLEHSPGGVADWFKDTLGGIFGGFYDVLIGVVTPSEIKDFNDAKQSAGYLVALSVDLVVLIAVLDVIATALSATLIRNLSHIGGLFIATFGFDRMVGATIAPALSAGLIPRLTQGFNEQYQAMLPGANDLVRFQLREVWDVTRREELLAEGASGTYSSLMAKQGFNKDISDDFWAAHWVLPSIGELNEMLHRGVINPATWDRFVKYNDYDPLVRPWLKAISFNPYTRVDSQRMWSLDLLTESELLQNYKDLGYDDEHAQRMTLWTKINVLATELRARYTKGWITSEQVKSELISEGMPAEKAVIWVQRIVKADKTARTETERNLTKSEIIKGYSKGLIDYPTSLSMLIDMGYDSDESEYILIVNTVAQVELPPEPPKRLTKAEIIKGYKLNIITYDYALQGLIDLNYTADDAAYLLAIGVPTEEA